MPADLGLDLTPTITDRSPVHRRSKDQLDYGCSPGTSGAWRTFPIRRGAPIFSTHSGTITRRAQNSTTTLGYWINSVLILQIC
jgi:hypothetical protein